jgi:hypothetical protein
MGVFVLLFSKLIFVSLFKFVPLFADIVKCDLQHKHQPTGEHIIWKLAMPTVKNVRIH